MEVVPLSDAKNRLSAIVGEITATHEHYTITKQGRPAVVMLPVDDLEAIEETLFWLRRELAYRDEPEGADVSGEEMAELMRQRRDAAGAA